MSKERDLGRLVPTKHPLSIYEEEVKKETAHLPCRLKTVSSLLLTRDKKPYQDAKGLKSEGSYKFYSSKKEREKTEDQPQKCVTMGELTEEKAEDQPQKSVTMGDRKVLLFAQPPYEWLGR